MLAVLFAIEASTSLARIAGINVNNLASGLQVQSGLSLFSRALMAIFMPTLGALADRGLLNENNLLIALFGSILIPIALLLTFLLKNRINSLYQYSAINLVNRGSYFPIGLTDNVKKINARAISARKLNRFRMITFLSYTPYYLAWPLIIYLLSIYPSDRGLIIGLSSIMNGLNTLALVMYVDPFLIRLSRHRNLSEAIYLDQLKLRIYSATLSCILFLITGLYLLYGYKIKILILNYCFVKNGSYLSENL
jgi:hypothetical protein